MNNCEKEMFCFSIAGVLFKIHTNCSNAVSFFRFEYSLLENTFSKNRNEREFLINIFFGKKPKEKKYVRYSAKNRHFFYDLDLNVCNVYIPYLFKNKDFFRILNPSFESKSVMCMIDFFHNTFLAIMQIILLEQNKTIFHCGGFFDSEINKKPVLLFSQAQSGKSAFSLWALENHNAIPISEDYCIVSSNNEFYSLPHSTRIMAKKEKGNFASNLNIALTKILKKEPIRRVAFDTFFKKTAPILSGNEYLLVFLCRNDTVFETCITNRVSFAFDVMKNEFDNYNQFDNVAKMMGIDYLTVLQKTYGVIKNVIDNSCFLEINIPYMNNFNDAALLLINKIKEGGCEDA